jgi:hypothetical protein
VDPRGLEPLTSAMRGRLEAFAGVLKTAYIRRIVEACVLGCSPVIAPVTVKSLSEVPTSRTGSLSFTRSDAAVRLDRKWNVNLVQA